MKRTVIETSYRVYGEAISPTAACTSGGLTITSGGDISHVEHRVGEIEFIAEIPEHYCSGGAAPTPVPPTRDT